MGALKLIYPLVFVILFSFVLNQRNLEGKMSRLRTLGNDIRDDLLDICRLSPKEIGLHDRDAWINLFTEDGFVNDPVGTPIHQGKEELTQFWNAFITGSNVTFSPHVDIVTEASRDVLRFVNITAAFPGDHVSTNQPAVLHYQITYGSKGYSIKFMKAYWVLIDRLVEDLGQGWNGILNLVHTTVKLIKYLGFSGTIEYMKGLQGVGKTGATNAFKIFDSMKNNDFYTFSSLVGNTIKRINVQYRNIMEVYQFKDNPLSFFWDDMVTRGDFKSVEILRDRVLNSGYNTAGIFNCKHGQSVVNSAFVINYTTKGEIDEINIWVERDLMN